MALDVGNVRIGIAVSDPMGIIANPLETYTRKGSTSADAEYICQLVKSHEVTKLVSGMPYDLKGRENEQAIRTREFIDALSSVCDIPIEYLDERFTTLSAERVLIDGNVRRQDRKRVIDKVAATIILQNYLDRQR